MREELLLKLTAKAISVEVGRIGDRLAKINSAFWAAHCKRAEKILPRDLWNPLMENQMLRATAKVSPEVPRGRDGCFMFPLELDVVGKEAHDWVFALLRRPEAAPVNRFLEQRNWHQGRAITLHCESGSVPYMPEIERVTDEKHVRELVAVAADINAMVAAAQDFKSQLWTVLSSCRSRKQLEDIMPEAAKLLPDAPKKSTSVMPVELARNVAQMLAAGVPPVEVRP